MRNGWLGILLGLPLLALIGFGFVNWRQQVALEQPLQLSAPWILEVSSGDTPNKVFNSLEQAGYLEGAFWLRVYWRLNLPNEKLFLGEYRLLPGMQVQDLLRLWQQKAVVQYSFTVVEGWGFRQLRAALADEPQLKQTLAHLSDSEVMAQLGYSSWHPEGRFFPDTYHYTKGMSDLDILKRAFARMGTILTEEWNARAEGLPYDSPYEALIMASIIEKETGVAAERPEISGVFRRRLDMGMLLQTDPTVIYGLGEIYNGRITRQDLRTPTPYNTYTQKGLPPTPIAMPGREALHAALHPMDGKALYFVAKGDGSHVFSVTLDAHNQAVRQYQLTRRADYRSSPPPEDEAKLQLQESSE